MKDFKGAYDALQGAIGKVNTILDGMEKAFAGQSDEEVQKALDMRPELEAAQAKADELRGAYDLMVKSASDQKSPAAKFVPTDEGAKKTADSAKTKTRAEFEQLTPQGKHAFLKDGGAVVDEAAE